MAAQRRQRSGDVRASSLDCFFLRFPRTLRLRNLDFMLPTASFVLAIVLRCTVQNIVVTVLHLRHLFVTAENVVAKVVEPGSSYRVKRRPIEDYIVAQLTAC
jgi:hypothetical protein